MTMIKIAPLEEAYGHSWFTIIGAGGDLNEWVEGYEKLMEDRSIGKPVAWYTTSGAAVNELAGSGVAPNDQFKDDLTFLLFPLDGLDVGRLAMFKLETGARWFDDIIDNMRPEEDEESEWDGD